MQVSTELRTQLFPNYVKTQKISQAKLALFYIQFASNKLFPFQKVVLHKNKHSQVGFSNSAMFW